jgi:hypothetical protein
MEGEEEKVKVVVKVGALDAVAAWTCNKKVDSKLS